MQQTVTFVRLRAFVNQSGGTVVAGSGDDLENLPSPPNLPVVQSAGKVIGKQDFRLFFRLFIPFRNPGGQHQTAKKCRQDKKTFFHSNISYWFINLSKHRTQYHFR